MISIIIPTLNEEKFLESTLEQFRLLKVDHELIITDGGSKDRTQEIARRYTSNVIVYVEKKRQTIPQAKNSGAAEAKGEILLFIDADVTIPNPNEILKKLLDEFVKRPKLVALTVPLRVDKVHETLADRFLFGYVNLQHSFNNNSWFGEGSASGEFQMIRRSAFDELNGYDETLVAYEDYDMFHRLHKIGKTRMVNSVCVFHTGRRVHKEGHFHVLMMWLLNGLWYRLFHKAYSKVWFPTR